MLFIHKGQLSTSFFLSPTPHRLIKNSAQPTRAIWLVFEQG
jgi:hypothetical protein